MVHLPAENNERRVDASSVRASANDPNYDGQQERQGQKTGESPVLLSLLGKVDASPTFVGQRCVYRHAPQEANDGHDQVDPANRKSHLTPVCVEDVHCVDGSMGLGGSDEEDDEVLDREQDAVNKWDDGARLEIDLSIDKCQEP